MLQSVSGCQSRTSLAKHRIANLTPALMVSNPSLWSLKQKQSAPQGHTLHFLHSASTLAHRFSLLASAKVCCQRRCKDWLLLWKWFQVLVYIYIYNTLQTPSMVKIASIPCGKGLGWGETCTRSQIETTRWENHTWQSVLVSLILLGSEVHSHVCHRASCKIPMRFTITLSIYESGFVCLICFGSPMSNILR